MFSQSPIVVGLHREVNDTVVWVYSEVSAVLIAVTAGFYVAVDI